MQACCRVYGAGTLEGLWGRHVVGSLVQYILAIILKSIRLTLLRTDLYLTKSYGNIQEDVVAS